MRILLTGITGFVGSHMCDYILKNMENIESVKIFATRRWRSDDSNIKHLYGDERVKFIEADLFDRGSLRNIIEVSQPNYVFHFASQSYPMASFNTPIYTLTTNTIGTVNLLEELKSARDKNICDPIIISVSSSEVYGNPEPDEVPIKETNPIRAANPYSISKVGHDLMSQFYHKAYGLKIITTRMFSHEGSRRGKLFALSNFAYQIVQHEKDFYLEREYPISFFSDTLQQDVKVEEFYEIKVGNLDSVRTYSHIDDAVEAYWLCAMKGKVGDVYNIGGDFVCKVGEALENLLSKSIIPRKKFKIITDPNRIRPTDITLQIPDCTKFKNLTGWKPKKTIDDICQDLLNYWRDKL